jgi:hypothetical protein
MEFTRAHTSPCHAPHIAAPDSSVYLDLMPWRKRFRGWMLLWALLQFALPTAASYADALLERTSANAQASHVEATASLSCVAVHPADCALCQLVHRVGAVAHAQCAPDIVVQTAPPSKTLVIGLPLSDRGRPALPRAPPAA